MNLTSLLTSKITQFYTSFLENVTIYLLFTNFKPQVNFHTLFSKFDNLENCNFYESNSYKKLFDMQISVHSGGAIYILLHGFRVHTIFIHEAGTFHERSREALRPSE